MQNRCNVFDPSAFKDGVVGHCYLVITHCYLVITPRPSRTAWSATTLPIYHPSTLTSYHPSAFKDGVVGLVRVRVRVRVRVWVRVRGWG